MSPLRFLGWILAALIGLILVAALAFNLYGREASWAALFGPADLGPYDFNQPTRSGKLNDTLACPPDACAKGLPDLETPHYQIAAPARNIRVASVTMKDGMLSLTTDRPLIKPTPTPTASMASIAPGTARAPPPR